MTKPSQIRLLFYAEDPGAANFVAPLIPAIAEEGSLGLFLAGGNAVEYSSELGITPEPVLDAPGAEEQFRRFRPHAVVVGTAANPDNIGFTLIGCAKKAGVPSVGVIDARMNAAFRFRGRSDSPLAQAPDWLLVPDRWTANAFASLGFLPERIEVCGHPHYDAVRSERNRLAGIGRRQLRRILWPELTGRIKVIVFIGEPTGGLDPRADRRSSDYTLSGRGRSQNRIEIVLEEFLDAAKKLIPRPYLVLRLHPRNAVDEFSSYAAEFDCISRGGTPLELLFAADLVVGMTSMSLLEAALLGTPTLSILPRLAEQEWLPTIAAGITPCATTRQAVSTLLAAGLETPPVCRRPEQVDWYLPPNSVQRAVQFLRGLTNVDG